MATLLDLFNSYQTNTTLLSRVVARCAVLARFILGEDPATQNHANRLTWAHAALRDPRSKAVQLFWAVLSDPAVTGATSADLQSGAAPTDAQVQAILDTILNEFADGSS